MFKNIKSNFLRILRWSEIYTKTDMVYLIKGSFWLNSATIINSFFSLILIYVLGNYLSQETYGHYRYILSIYGLFSIFTLNGFNTAVTRSVAKNFEGDLMRGFKRQVVASLLGSTLSFIGAGYYWLRSNELLSCGLILVGLSLPLMEPATIYNSLLNGKKLFLLASTISSLSQLIATIALIITAINNDNPIPLLIVYFSAWSFCRLITLIIIKKYYQTNKSYSPDLIANGWHFSLVGMLSSIASYLDRILLFQFIGVRELALFSFAIAPTEQLKSLFKNFNILAMPKFSKRTEKELRENLNHKIMILGTAALVVSLIYILLAPFLIKTFLPKYIEITFMSQVLAISLLGVVVMPITTAMNSIPKIKALYLSNLVSPLINIVLFVILIPWFGLWGAVWAKTIGRLFNIFANFIIFKLLKN